MSPQASIAVQPAKTTSITRHSQPQDAFERMQQLTDSISRRAFEIFEGNGRWLGHDLSDWLEAESEILHPMHLEIAETEGTLSVKAEVPGFTAKELDIRVEGDRLTISGRHESKEESAKGRTIYSERCANEIFRSITLPSAVDGPKANATLKDGILSIELPKAPYAKNVRIEAKAAG